MVPLFGKRLERAKEAYGQSAQAYVAQMVRILGDPGGMSNSEKMMFGAFAFGNLTMLGVKMKLSRHAGRIALAAKSMLETTLKYPMIEANEFMVMLMEAWEEDENKTQHSLLYIAEQEGVEAFYQLQENGEQAFRDLFQGVLDILHQVESGGTGDA